MLNINDLDSASIKVQVNKQPSGDPFDLTEATIVAVAKRNGGGPERFLGTVTPIDLAGGRVQVSWPPGTFEGELGTITYHVRVGRDGELQTVYEGVIAVGKSIREPT